MVGPQDFTEAIDPDALKVVRRLLTAGHEAYLVGGCVRDLYLGRRPKDFDIATSATPEVIRRLFRNSRIIGRRFKLAHVFFGAKIIETATFRSAPLHSEDDPLITHDNEWGSVEDDARRRDFTINGLFFDVETEKIVDFVDGMDDLDARLIRTIGDPATRFREDPVRMIRAVKFAARLGFNFEPATYAALLEVAPDIVKCSKARVLEEIYKLLRSGSARRTFELMLEVGLFEHVMGPYLRLFGEPVAAKAALLAAATNADADPLEPATLLWRLLGALDKYVSQTDEAVINGVLQAVLFAPMVGRDLAAGNRQNLDRTIDNRMGAVGAVMGIARRDRELARQILMAHQRLIEPAGRRRRSGMTTRQYLHDALVFLALWVDAIGNGRNELAQWQRMAQQGQGPNASGSGQSGAGQEPGRSGGGPDGGEPTGGRKRRRRGGRGKRSGDEEAVEPAVERGPGAHVDGT